MATKDVYEELADMLVTAPTGGPGMKTPELMEILRLTYTPREARVAVQVGFEGAKLDEISEKTGIEKGKLKRILDTMAEKCTMWIDPGKEDPTYRAGGIAGCGISETLWGGYPVSVFGATGETMEQVQVYLGQGRDSPDGACISNMAWCSHPARRRPTLREHSRASQAV